MTAIKEQVGRDAIEHASVDEIRNVQLERLKWTLKHAYDNVPHYRQKFDEAGVHPDDCRSLEQKHHQSEPWPYRSGQTVPGEEPAAFHSAADPKR